MTDVVVSDAQAELARAQQELDRAQQQADRARHIQLTAELARVRSELRQAREDHDALAARIHPARERLNNQNGRIHTAMEQIAGSEKARPACADWLPDDPEVVAWTKQHAALKVKADRLILERNKMPDPNDITSEANRYEGPAGLIVVLMYTEQNLMRMLEGCSGIVRLEGGVFGVP
jgi:DNA repair exonuclease SbcCD ATPase subunit